MASATILSSFPNLAAHLTEGSHEYPSLFMSFIQSLNSSDIPTVATAVARVINSIPREFAVETIQQFEDLCSANACNLNQIFLMLAEKALIDGCAEDLYHSLGRLAQSTELSVYFFMAAWLALNLDKLQECITICSSCPQKNADIYGLQGQASLESGKYEDAMICFEQSTSLAPKDPLQWFWLAKTSYALGEVDEAWDAAISCHKLEHSNVQCGLLLSIIACTEPVETRRLEVAWRILWNMESPNFSNAYLVGILFDLCLRLREPEKG